jgi:hypothetical protein
MSSSEWQSYFLQTAMKLADVIRRKETEAAISTDVSAAGSSSSGSGSNDPLQPVQTFLQTPGVQQGIFTVVGCVLISIPTRRLVLHVSDKHLGLGRSFPDLVISPALAMLTGQSALYVGSLYGAKQYLQRLADFDHDGRYRDHRDGVVHSPILDSICGDAVTVDALQIRDSPDYAYSWNATAKLDSAESWDPRVQTVQALQRALETCSKRQKY